MNGVTISDAVKLLCQKIIVSIDATYNYVHFSQDESNDLYASLQTDYPNLEKYEIIINSHQV